MNAVGKKHPGTVCFTDGEDKEAGIVLEEATSGYPSQTHAGWQTFVLGKEDYMSLNARVPVRVAEKPFKVIPFMFRELVARIEDKLACRTLVTFCHEIRREVSELIRVGGG
jgi:hypothetical protein